MNEFALEELKRCEVEKYDCAACHEGRCVALNDTRFKTGVCPFYKTKEQNDAEQKACMETRRGRGRSGKQRKCRRPVSSSLEKETAIHYNQVER